MVDLYPRPFLQLRQRVFVRKVGDIINLNLDHHLPPHRVWPADKARSPSYPNPETRPDLPLESYPESQCKVWESKLSVERGRQHIRLGEKSWELESFEGSAPREV